MIHLVIGGARSGKSSFAEKEVLSLSTLENRQAVYIATATAGDSEMQNRINQHQCQRQLNDWQLLECPLALAELFISLEKQSVYLLDCLTLWLTNVLMQADAKCSSEQDKLLAMSAFIEQQVEQITQTLSQAELDIIIVTNEVGQGIVPMGEQTRLFVDHAGWLNQAIAKIADKVTLVTAGIPLQLKPQIASMAGGCSG